MISFDVELYHRTQPQLRILALRQQGVTMHEEIPSKSVGVDEAPGALERSDVPAQPVANPIAGSQQSSCGDLLRHRPSTIIQGNVKLYNLPRSENRLTIGTSFRTRLKQEVVPVNEEVSIKGGGIEEAPTLGETPYVAPVPLAKNIVWLSAQDRLYSYGHGFAVLVGLNIELDSFVLMKGMSLKLRHDSIYPEHQLALEHVTFHHAVATDRKVLRHGANKPFLLQVKCGLDR
mmetsp:Transcript_40519/g.94726  ORF Transcript_40519/g.94726 Transcript_40519/m.94726 type:complete len:232 (+) Transcript_40519:735-1430(+)